MQIVDSPDAASGKRERKYLYRSLKRLKGLDEHGHLLLQKLKSDDRIPPEIKLVLSQPYAKDSSNIAGPVIGTEAPGAAARN